MNTKILEYIIAIAEERSVSRAGERFYLSHAALSRHLKNVEAEVGTPLFVRGRDGMSLTPAGAVYVNDAYAILKLERELEQTLASMRLRAKQTLRVMVDAPLYNRFLQLVLPRFRECCSDFEVDVINCNAEQARRTLLSGSADLGVFHSISGQAGDLEYLDFATSTLRLAFPKGYDGRVDLAGLEEALEGGMYMILHPVGSTMRTIEEQLLADHQVYPSQILDGDSRSSISHISEGETCGILAGMFCTPETTEQVCFGEVMGIIHRVIAYAQNAGLPPAAQELMKFIMEAFPSDEL